MFVCTLRCRYRVKKLKVKKPNTQARHTQQGLLSFAHTHLASDLAVLQEICRSLDLDLRGQTSASYNMRLNYEKCLLEFERYLALGRYSADLAEGTAPPTHHLEAPPAVKPTQGHTPPLPFFPASGLMCALPAQKLPPVSYNVIACISLASYLTPRCISNLQVALHHISAHGKGVACGCVLPAAF